MQDSRGNPGQNPHAVLAQAPPWAPGNQAHQAMPGGYRGPAPGLRSGLGTPGATTATESAAFLRELPTAAAGVTGISYHSACPNSSGELVRIFSNGLNGKWTTDCSQVMWTLPNGHTSLPADAQKMCPNHLTEVFEPAILASLRPRGERNYRQGPILGCAA